MIILINLTRPLELLPLCGGGGGGAGLSVDGALAPLHLFKLAVFCQARVLMASSAATLRFSCCLQRKNGTSGFERQSCGILPSSDTGLSPSSSSEEDVVAVAAGVSYTWGAGPSSSRDGRGGFLLWRCTRRSFQDPNISHRVTRKTTATIISMAHSRDIHKNSLTHDINRGRPFTI